MKLEFLARLAAAITGVFTPAFRNAELRFCPARRQWASLWWVIVALVAVSTLNAGDLVVPRRISPGLNILVTADAINGGQGLRPESGRPVHYIFNQTRETLGDAVGGVKLPSPAAIEKAVVVELAKQGFVRTDVGGPIPQILIIAIVGDSNFEEPPVDFDDPLGDADFSRYMRLVNVGSVLKDGGLWGDPDIQGGLDRIFSPNIARSAAIVQARDLIIADAMRIRSRMSQRSKDRPKIHALVGATKVTRGVEERTLTYTEAERIAWIAADNSFYISLNAFDAVRWKNKERVLLWRTTMLIDWRKDFAAELPTMLAHAGPMFGTDMAVPGFFDERTRAKAEVNIGEAKVVSEETPAPSPKTKK